jgi:hypothetical protein
METLEREMKLFRTLVELMRLGAADFHYYSHYPWQARIVAANILTFAENNNCPLRIFSGDLVELCEDEIIDRILALAENGISVDIVLPEPLEKKDQLKWRRLCSAKNVRVSYMAEYDASLNHLWLAGTAYRFEFRHEKYKGSSNDTSPSRHARFGFHCRKDAEDVKRYWDAMIADKAPTQLGLTG